MPKRFTPWPPAMRGVNVTFSVPAAPGARLIDAVLQFFCPSAPGLSTRQETVTAFWPAFFTSTSRYAWRERSQCPAGAFRVMPGQSCLCPLETRSADPPAVFTSETVTSCAGTAAKSNPFSKSRSV